MNGGGFDFSPPKSTAGRRFVIMPETIIPAVRLHLRDHAERDDESLLFTSPEGTPLGHSNFRRRIWLPALRSAGLPMIHFHDLRHTGNQLAADTGAGLRELMDRMGHSSSRAAMIYLHGGDDRQRVIAEGISKAVAAEMQRSRSRRSGTQRARRRRRAL
jgi:integrase